MALRPLLLTFLVACGGGGATHPDAGPDPSPDAPADTPQGAPIVAISTPAPHATIHGSRTIAVTGTLAAPLPIATVHVVASGGGQAEATFDQTSFSATVAVGDNASTITVTATDSAGHAGTASVAIDYPFVALGTLPAASLVIGQRDFTTGGGHGPDAYSVDDPYGGPAITDDGRLYVPAGGANRFDGFSTPPTTNGARVNYVLGQTSTISSTSTISASGAAFPQGLWVDGGHLYGDDYDAARIVMWATPPTTTGAPVDLVIGQPDATSTDTTCDAHHLDGPEDFIVAGGHVIVGDSNHNRVLIWNQIPTVADTPPDVVLGQIDFTHCAPNDDNGDGTTDQASGRTFSYPAGVWSDGTRLYVADYSNNRVLLWNTLPATSFTPADAVIGQPDATTTDAGTTASRLSTPYFVTSNGNQLAVADSSNNRVLVWDTLPAGDVAADHVIGQSDFTSSAKNAGAAPSASGLSWPAGVRFIGAQLFVTDNGNQRILEFGPLPCPEGQYERPYGSGTCVDDPCLPIDQACNAGTCDRATGAAVCSCPGLSDTCTACAVRVSPTGTPDGDGTTWATTTSDLPSARVAAAAIAAENAPMALSCEVWFAQGTYYTYKAAPTDSVLLDHDVAIYGGFAGDETTRAQRHGEATIFDGHDSAAETAQSYHVVISATANATLDGVTVQHGAAVGTGTNHDGGGIYIPGGHLALSHATVRDNLAAGDAGGIMVNGPNSHLDATATLITGNRATNGGGVYFSAGHGSLADCILTQNLGQSAAGVFLRDSDASLTNLTVTGNVAAANGGGIGIDGATSALTNLIVAGNAGASDFSPNNYTGTVTASDMGAFDPAFASAPAGWDRATAVSADTLTVDGRAAYAVGDTILLGDDGVARTVTAVNGTAITVTPAPAATQSYPAVVANWGTAATRVLDVHLTEGSSCIDAGDGDLAPATDFAGSPRRDDPNVADTGTGTPAYTDLGALEY